MFGDKRTRREVVVPRPLSSDQPSPPEKDGEALGLLYRQEAHRLRRFFRGRIDQADDAADLVQESFLRFAASDARHVESPPAYLWRIARNLLFDRSRRHVRRPEIQSPHPSDPVACPPEQAYQLEAADLMRRYQEAVDALPPRTREVFLCHRVDGLTYAQVAEQLGIGVRTVEWHIAEALVRIRRLLDEE